MDTPRAYNAAVVMVDGNVDRGHGDKVAFIDPARRLSYGELQRQTCRAAGMLVSLGIEREARVALLMHDTVDYPVMFWGAIRAGIVPVCLNTLLTADLYRYMLRDSRAQVLVVSPDLLEVVRPLLDDLPALRHVIVAGESDTFPRLAHLLAQAPDSFPAADTCADETAFWLYSSGSTGAPKGVRHVHGSPRYIADTYGRHVLGIRHDDVCLSAAKLFFAYGHGASMALPMSVGATTVLMPGRPTPETVLAAMRAYRPTLFFGVPTLYAALMADPACRPGNASDRLRLCVSAGEALPAAIGRAWEARMGVPVLDGVGSTEMLHVFVSNRPGENRYGTAGRAFEGYRLRLVDEAGNDVPDGEPGEMLVAGDSAGDGYWNQRAKTRATFLGEWVRTGDRYVRDAEGYYRYCGRCDDMFKVSGRWVSPIEVEEALTAHAAVAEAAVVPRDAGDGLIKPMAFVVLAEGFEADEALFAALRAHVKRAVGVWKYPRWIEVCEALPRTATGKIQRYRLRARTGGTGGTGCADGTGDTGSAAAGGGDGGGETGAAGGTGGIDDSGEARRRHA